MDDPGNKTLSATNNNGNLLGIVIEFDILVFYVRNLLLLDPEEVRGHLIWFPMFPPEHLSKAGNQRGIIFGCNRTLLLGAYLCK